MCRSPRAAYRADSGASLFGNKDAGVFGVYLDVSLLYTTRPPSTVRMTRVPRISSDPIVMMSRSSTTKSANLPAVSVPLSFSMNAAYAGHSVIDSSASSRVSRCAGNQPPAGYPSASWRVTEAWNERSGFEGSTGRSDPFGITTPVFRSDRQAYAPSDRAQPSRAGTQYMSLV